MSWLFSQALVAEFSADTCSDGAQSAQSKSSHTQLAYCSPGRMTEFSRLSRYGITFAPLTADRGEALLTWFLEGFRARTLARQEKVLELTEIDLGCGEKWHESSVRYDLDSSSWKIHLSLFPEDLPWSSVTLPRWGMTRSGVVYQHPTAERPIRGTESGLWQTPVADDSVNLAKGKWNSRGEPKLSGQVLSPAHWPTPNASDGNKWSNQSLADRKAKGQQVRLNTAVSPEGGAGGQLNPTWVEKLMGWPDDWTSLQPISHVKMCFWLMGFIDEKDRRTAEVLRMLRKGNATEEIQREIGRPVSFHEAAILLSELCEHENRFDEARVFMACAQALEEELRGVRMHPIATGSPYRSEQSQQRLREYPDAMQAMSRFLARHGQTYWQDGRWEDATPRVAHGMAARVVRLKAIGNGQVPAVAAAAWRLLTDSFRTHSVHIPYTTT